jgi:Flp pilus assembly pilin Flp
MNHQNDIQDRDALERREKLISAFKRFMRDESGQGTAEYALILLVVLMMANTFKKQFKGLLDSLMKGLSTQISEATEDTG